MRRRRWRRRRAATRETQHIDDARSAAQALHARLMTGEAIETAVTVEESFNLLGAMMMRTGWTNDANVLSQSCLVVRPKQVV